MVKYRIAKMEYKIDSIIAEPIDRPITANPKWKMISWYGLSVFGLPAHSLDGSFSLIKATKPRTATAKNCTKVNIMEGK